jgi:hypothetical protein
MPLDLTLFLFSILFMFFQGIPRVMRRVKMPAKLYFVQMSDDEFTEKQKKYYGESDAKMASLGFTPVLNYKVPNLPGPNISRCYLSTLDPARINSILLLGSRTQENPIQIIYTEIVTNFTDETSLTTMNANSNTLFDPLPGRLRQKFPSLKDPIELKRQHDLKTAEFKEKNPIFIKKEDILVRHEKYHQQFCDYQVQRGLLRAVPGTDYYDVTFKTALRAVFHQINPFDQTFLWRNFFLAFVGAVVLPWMGALYGPAILEPLHQLTQWNMEILGGLYYFFIYSLGGAIVGYVFSRKVFIWGFILAYFPLRVFSILGLIGSGPYLAIFSLWLTSVAHEVSLWRRKRERII